MPFFYSGKKNSTSAPVLSKMKEYPYPHNGLHISFVKAFGLLLSCLNLRVTVCEVWCVCWWDREIDSLEKGFVVPTIWTEACLILVFLKPYLDH